MDPDARLEQAVASWLSKSGYSARLDVLPETSGGGPTVCVLPDDHAATSVRFRVADDPDEMYVGIGSYCWWPEVKYSEDAIRKVCDAVSGGGYSEEAKVAFGVVVARRASLRLGSGDTWKWGQLNPFLVFPWPQWRRIEQSPWCLKRPTV